MHRRIRHRTEIIASFEESNHGDVTAHGPAQDPRCECVVLAGQIDACQGVLRQGIEADAEDEEVRVEPAQGGCHSHFQDLPKHGGAISGAQRDVEDVAIHTGDARIACEGVRVSLMRTAIEEIGVVPEARLDAVAVVHINVDHGDPLHAVGVPGVLGRDARVVEEAEPHRPLRLGMVARRPAEAEGHAIPTAVNPQHRRIHRRTGPASSKLCRFLWSRIRTAKIIASTAASRGIPSAWVQSVEHALFRSNTRRRIAEDSPASAPSRPYPRLPPPPCRSPGPGRSRLEVAPDAVAYGTAAAAYRSREGNPPRKKAATAAYRGRRGPSAPSEWPSRGPVAPDAARDSAPCTAGGKSPAKSAQNRRKQPNPLAFRPFWGKSRNQLTPAAPAAPAAPPPTRAAPRPTWQAGTQELVCT
eukprot:scaffold1130_cov195-Pinguiococcus_pyrenoidosus.AAC.49